MPGVAGKGNKLRGVESVAIEIETVSVALGDNEVWCEQPAQRRNVCLQGGFGFSRRLAAPEAIYQNIGSYSSACPQGKDGKQAAM
jgi:hypothetical protein